VLPVVDLGRGVSGEGAQRMAQGRVAYIGSADTSPLDVDDYIVVILDLGNWAVAVGDLVRLLEDECWVLDCVSAEIPSVTAIW